MTYNIEYVHFVCYKANNIYKHLKTEEQEENSVLRHYNYFTNMKKWCGSGQRFG